MMITEDQYIEVYDRIGHKHYAKGDDDELKRWGNSEQKIREIKIECVKHELKWSKNGIDAYKLLNEMCGGKNVI